MKFTLSWLKDHLETDASLDRIAEALTALGLEVEDIADPTKSLSGFVVGHVIEAVKHPDADRLQVCTVDDGGTKLQVVCGAPNARAGLKVILARPGVVIPITGEPLKKGVVRGVESQGMLCSLRELKLGEDHEGIAELAADAPVGAPLLSVLPVDPVIEVKVTPNRPDWLGVRGIARELAVKGLGRLKPFAVPEVPGRFPGPAGLSLRFDEASKGACPLFIGRLIKGVTNRESPAWLKDRLTAIGLRPISALVDITNHVSVDLARPLHVFDAAKVTGAIHVRMARPGETLNGLGGRSIALDETMIVIADDRGAVSLAGILGGEETGCTPVTTDVYLEVALFDPIRIAAAGRKLDLVSDARYRFERGVDPGFAFDAAQHATRLILELCGGEASDLSVAGAVPEWRTTISMRPERVGKLIGLDVPIARQRAILESLGCEVADSPAGLRVTPPSWRIDLKAEHDLIEEVARIEGLDSIPAVPLPRPPAPPPTLTPAQRRISAMRRQLAARGLVEAVTFSFLPAAQARLFGGGGEEMALANPISADLDSMRPSLLPNLIAASGRNRDRSIADAALFEIGPQFDGPEPGQQRLVAAGLRSGGSGLRHWLAPRRPVDAFDAKADIWAALIAAGANPDSLTVAAGAAPWYHPGRSGQCKLGNKIVAAFGEIHPRVLTEMGVDGPITAFEIFIDELPLPKVRATKAKPALKASDFQPVERDFAFILDVSVPAETLVRAVKGADKMLIAEVRVFDQYQGPGVGDGKKSLALSVTLRPQAKTLTDDEIEAVARAIVEAAAKATGAQLRG